MNADKAPWTRFRDELHRASSFGDVQELIDRHRQKPTTRGLAKRLSAFVQTRRAPADPEEAETFAALVDRLSATSTYPEGQTDLAP